MAQGKGRQNKSNFVTGLRQIVDLVWVRVGSKVGKGWGLGLE